MFTPFIPAQAGIQGACSEFRTGSRFAGTTGWLMPPAAVRLLGRRRLDVVADASR